MSDSALVRDSPPPVQRRRPGVMNRRRKTPEAVKSDAGVNYGKYQDNVRPRTKRPKSRSARNSTCGFVQLELISEAQDIDQAFDVVQYLENIETSALHLARRERSIKVGEKGESDIDVPLAADRVKVSQTVDLCLVDMNLIGEIEVTNLTKLNLTYKFLCTDKSVQSNNDLIGWILPLKTIKLKFVISPDACLSVMNSYIGLGIHPVYSPRCLSKDGLQRVWQMISTNCFGITADIHEITMISNGKNIGPIKLAEKFFFGRKKILEVPFKKFVTPIGNNLNLYSIDDTGIKVEEYIILREQHRNLARGITSVKKSCLWCKMSKCWWIIPIIFLVLFLAWSPRISKSADRKIGKGAERYKLRNN